MVTFDGLKRDGLKITGYSAEKQTRARKGQV